MKKRKKITPLWLSIMRKIYTYVGATALFSMLEGRFGLLPKDILLIIELYMFGGVVIQIICDASYAKDPLQDMPAEKSNKIKS